MEIIHECHEAWRRLISGEAPAKTANYDLSMCVFYILLLTMNSFLHGIFSRNVTFPNSPGYINKTDPGYTSLPLASPRPPEPIDPSGESRLVSGRNRANRRASFQVVPYLFCSGLTSV